MKLKKIKYFKTEDIIKIIENTKVSKCVIQKIQMKRV